ncbi:MAG: RNA polymerase sigma factor [Pseudomonadota bacterium]
MTDNNEDAELLRKVAAGKRDAPKALEALYTRYAQPFFAFLRKRGLSKEDAEEVIQKTFVNLMGRQLNVETIENGRAYLWRCLRYAWQDHLRDSGKEPSITATPADEDSADLLLERLTDDTAPIDDMLGLKDCLGRMWSQFSEEHEERATAIYLAVVEGWSREDLAQFLNRSYGATREFISQCRKRFITVFSEICPDYMPGTGGSPS